MTAILRRQPPSLPHCPDPEKNQPVAAGKFAKLGQDYEPYPMTAPGAEDLARVIACFAAHGLTATVG